MIIKVFPRKFFLKILGTNMEDEMVDQWNIISINTPAYPPKKIIREMPPFSDKNIDKILALYFHDTDLKVDKHVVLFTRSQAEQILQFVKNTIHNGKGYLIHCTAGKSRSQAVGLVLNEFLNKFVIGNQYDYDMFEKENENIRIPNRLVKTLLWNTFENNLEELKNIWRK